ncbi:hypothetical protein BLOT_012551 [Blomia tropicalis]|nr:hypothetical protein BLOT_012551 [Blomia tropicalis]
MLRIEMYRSIEIFILLMILADCNCKLYNQVQFYDDRYPYGNNQSDYENETNYSYYDYDNYSPRIRYLKMIQVNLNVSLDLQLSIPLGDLGSFDMDMEISFQIQNKTFLKFPYPDPPLKIPIFYPIIKLPKLFHSYPAKQPSYTEFYDHLDQSYSDDQDQDLYEYYNHPKHQISKRSLAAQSNQHRYEIFQSIENSLERYGYNGKQCLLKAICQLAQRELLIETPFHEILEHLLTVSRGIDEHNILEPYSNAERLGEQQHDCISTYSCPFSLFQSL